MKKLTHKFIVEVTPAFPYLVSNSRYRQIILNAFLAIPEMGNETGIRVKDYRKVEAWKNSTKGTTLKALESGGQKSPAIHIDSILDGLTEKQWHQLQQYVTAKIKERATPPQTNSSAKSRSKRSMPKNSKEVIQNHLKRLTASKRR